MQLLDGKKLSLTIADEIKEQTAEWVARGNRKPHLAAVLVGNDGASATYVGHKIKKCEYVGFKSSVLNLDENISESELIVTIDELNRKDEVDGFIVQLPLPKHINVTRITEAVDHRKDVDGFHPVNIGKMVQGLPSFLPATPMGIMLLLERYGVETSGKHCVVLGRSNIVGSPMSILLSKNKPVANCTVTLCHSRTKNLEEHTQRADILIAALGKPCFVTSSMVKDGAAVIDVGITRVPDSNKKSGFRLQGDVDFQNVAQKCSWITPVPGGVGPMTVCSLLLNTLQAAKNRA